MKKSKKVLVALSGGVDSSVAAAVLLEQGYDVVGVTMQVWDYSSSCPTEKSKGTCCSSLDTEDARTVADHLKIPFYILNYESEFQKKVINKFTKSYLKGETPIPCVDCNTHFKFDALFQKMHELNCDYLATGHYAQIQSSEHKDFGVFVSTDTWKDQTYFLFTLKKELLSRLLFPVGNWEKSKLRKYAEEKGLPVAQKKDSTGLCFIESKKGYSTFVEKQKPEARSLQGLLKQYPSGDILGKHKGIHHFTYGQRKGLGVFQESPLYVVKIDAHTQDVWLGQEEHLYGRNLTIQPTNFFKDLEVGLEYKVKIRFHHKGSLAKVVKKTSDYLHLQFNQPQRAITPGQAAVVYEKNQLLGGGWIV